MRIISQSGRIDIPYEMAVVYVEYESVIAKVGDERYSMGKYSTEEKVFKAMKMLIETYTGMPIVMQNVDVSEDMEKEFERLKKCGVIVQAENQPSKVDFINNAFFQFPQDDEIEV
nr:MAG TPA: hypothetical protein [Bacteriophage sp.]